MPYNKIAKFINKSPSYVHRLCQGMKKAAVRAIINVAAKTRSKKLELILALRSKHEWTLE